LRRIRVLLAAMSQTLRDTLTQLMAPQPDMEVIDEMGPDLELLVTVGQIHPDVLILGLESSRFPGISSHLLAEYPRLKILGLTADCGEASVCESEPREVPLGQVSREKLLALIRGGP
jgi:DNA-binding NarL/FixJ family response regulator